MYGKFVQKKGVIDVERIGRKMFQLTYWNSIGCVGAVAIYCIGEGVHLIDCNNPYSDEADKEVIKAMAQIKFFCELPFSDPPEWVTNLQSELKAQKAAQEEEDLFRSCPFIERKDCQSHGD